MVDWRTPTNVNSKFKRNRAAYDWERSAERKCCADFEKTQYCIQDAYDTPSSIKTGLAFSQNKRANHDTTKGNYVHEAPGFRDAGHLVADDISKKFKRLGHVKEKKLVGWAL